jgi:hypothetical protein
LTPNTSSRSTRRPRCAASRPSCRPSCSLAKCARSKRRVLNTTPRLRAARLPRCSSRTSPTCSSRRSATFRRTRASTFASPTSPISRSRPTVRFASSCRPLWHRATPSSTPLSPTFPLFVRGTAASVVVSGTATTSVWRYKPYDELPFYRYRWVPEPIVARRSRARSRSRSRSRRRATSSASSARRTTSSGSFPTPRTRSRPPRRSGTTRRRSARTLCSSVHQQAAHEPRVTVEVSPDGSAAVRCSRSCPTLTSTRCRPSCSS